MSIIDLRARFLLKAMEDSDRSNASKGSYEPRNSCGPSTWPDMFVNLVKNVASSATLRQSRQSAKNVEKTTQRAKAPRRPQYIPDSSKIFGSAPYGSIIYRLSVLFTERIGTDIIQSVPQRQQISSSRCFGRCHLRLQSHEFRGRLGTFSFRALSRLIKVNLELSNQRQRSSMPACVAGWMANWGYCRAWGGQGLNSEPSQVHQKYKTWFPLRWRHLRRSQ